MAKPNEFSASTSSRGRKPRKFTNEFKRDAVRLVTREGYSVAQAAESLGVHQNQIRRWKEKFMAENNEETVLSEDEKAELKRLREEVRKLRMERDIFRPQHGL